MNVFKHGYTVILALCVAASILSGCATYLARVAYGADGTLYPACRYDAAAPGYAYDYIGDLFGFAAVPLALIDLPFSVATDTLCLPYDVYKKSNRRESCH